MKKVERGTLIICSVEAIIVIVFNLVPKLFVQVELWPMFLASIFFFLVAHGLIDKIPHILASGTAGILITLLLFAGIGALTPAVGSFAALCVCLPVALILIIVVGAFFPFFLNGISFAYLTMMAYALESKLHIDGLESALALPGHTPFSVPRYCLVSLAVLLIGGSMFCLTLGWAKVATSRQLAKAAGKTP